MTLSKSSKLVAVALASSLACMPVSAFAQSTPIEFRLAPAKANSSSCTSHDVGLSRVHTITLMGDTANIKSAGGITDKMKLISPGVYTSSSSLGGATLVVTANASKTPRTLEVKEPKLGCTWNATAP